MNFDFGTGMDRNYNLASLGLAVASLFVCIITLLMLLFGGGGNNPQPFPTQLSIPTATNTLTPTITRTPLPATFTPTFTATSTMQATTTATATFTTSPTFSPTPTITTTVLPSNTPTETPTPLPTLGTPDASPPPFLFIPQSDPQLTTELSGNCAFQGIGGQVLNTAGDAATTFNVQIIVSGGGVPEQSVAVGSNTLYGPGGYEVQIGTALTANRYFVQVRSPLGTELSELVLVDFPGNCENNLALVTFQQTRDNP